MRTRMPQCRAVRLLPVWAALVLALIGASPAPASVLNARVPGAWPGGRIVWYYNPMGQPADLGTDEIIAAVTAALAGWGRVCQVEGTYGGLTSVPVDPVPTTAYVIGWTDFGSPEFSAKGLRRAAGGSSSYAPLTGGGIQLNTSRTDWRARLDSGSFVGTVHHEIGHTLGLAHSDEPVSIMFANPYHTGTYLQTLQGDDVAACGDLYGARGLAAKDDLREVPLAGVYPVQVSVLATRPTSTPPAGSLAEVDPLGGGPYYFARHWQGLPVGTELEARWVTPDGSVYQRRLFTTTSSTGFRFSTLPDDDVRLPFAGRWAFQLLVDGHLAASVDFVVVRGSLTPVRPAEVAVVGEADGGGSLRWRVVTYGSGTVKRLSVIANAVVATGAAHRATPGENLVEVWVETDRPRYKPDQDDGQPATSFDVVRRVPFVAGTDGLPVSSALRFAESGTPDAYTATATLAVADPGPQGIYVAAVVGGRVYYRHAAGWSTLPEPLVTVQAPAVAGVDLVRNVDTRGLPAGSALYVGWGPSLGDVVARGQYARVRRF